MEQSIELGSTRGAEVGQRWTSGAAPVGASYGFDPGADGIAAIYAARVLERGADPRLLCADIRADRLGAADRVPRRRVSRSRQRTTRFGRGTAQRLQAARIAPPSHAGAKPDSRSRRRQSAGLSKTRDVQPGRRPRQLAIAGLLALLIFPLGIILANAQEGPSQARYIVQPGDTLESVASEFGVDPAAILAARALQNPPQLTAAETIIIPDPSESPEAAAANAAQRQGSSPFVVGAYDVAPGETLASIASAIELDPWALANFNGLSDIDTLASGQRLRIPLTDRVVIPAAPEPVAETTEELAAPAAETWVAETWAEETWTTEAVGGVDSSWDEPAAGPVFAAGVPAYYQAYSLSCEYAAAYIATAGFGWGISESAFVERIGASLNPHWGYRGNIHGAWGGSDDYGIYPEALVPTLNEFGFVGDVFYGGNAASLTSRIDAGMPVITWLGYFGDTSWMQEDEGSYLLAPGMHVVTVYGYDDAGVYLSNPGRGNYDYYAWGDFLSMWSVLDGMALAVAPM